MAVDYNDERFQSVNEEKKAALNNINNTYNNMINQSDNFYNNMANQVQENANVQKEIQQANTDFAIEKIEQQKELAEKDYLREQKGAYADYQKQIDNYGVNNENMAASGLTNTGYSESSKVSMFNTYQNRYATARDSYNRAVQNYDNGIKEAMLSNNAKLAEITAQAQTKALELALQGFQYKNTLLQSQITMVNNTEDRYYSRWKDTLNQINTENALEENKRQFNESLKVQKAAAKNKSSNKGSSIKKGGNSGQVQLTNTGFDLNGWAILKGGDKYYYQNKSGQYIELPVNKETKNTITFNDGTVVTK